MKKSFLKFWFLAVPAFFFAVVAVLFVSNLAYAENDNSANEKLIQDGYYQIESADEPSKVMGVSGNTMVEKLQKNQAVTLQAPDKSDSQVWKVSNDGQGNVKLINVNSGFFIAPADGNVYSGILSTANNKHDNAGYWKPVSDGDSFTLQYVTNENRIAFMNVNTGDNFRVNGAETAGKWKFKKVDKPTSDMPSFNISLKDTSYENMVTSNDPENAPKEAYDGNTLVINDDSNTDNNMSLENVRVKGRGNSTWTHSDKKAFGLKLDKKQNLMGLGSSKNWVLIANAFDTTNLHNETAFSMARMLQIPFAFEGRFVNLYMDDEYVGVYWLTHKVEISKNSADLEDDSIIVCLDGHNEKGFDDIYFTDENIKALNTLCLKDYKLKDEEKLSDVQVGEKKKELLDKFKIQWQKFTKAVVRNDFEEMNKYMDMDSLASFFIIADLSFNSDAFRYSTNFYLSPSNDKIVAAPFWDFDLSFDVKNWWINYDLNPYRNFNTMFADSRELNNFLSDNPGFMNIVKEKYKTLSSNQTEIIKNIGASYNTYKNSFDKNDAKWRYIMNQWPKNLKSIKESMDEFIKFISERFDYFDTFYLKRAEFANGTYNIIAPNGNNFYNGTFRLENNGDGTVSLFSDHKDGGYLCVANYGNEANNWGIQFNATRDKDDPETKYYSEWLICESEDGYVLVSKNPGLVLDVDPGEGGMHLRNLGNPSSQKFSIQPVK